ncbi:LysR family transcriptional regulator [Amycolatopsis anabasis]|uniref:LysR family transcriptional regulator n=1 Tax=Amycolatopsis anabasis TaxID=1840409 RepID=UPI001C5528C2|nr:LysR family transcriptional regulator [Amycolatopsis anabasis]
MADVDLNLLVVLDALLTEGSVTGAAERLHLSAPATSRALGRLRRTLGDPILVRAGRTMVPTPAAIALRSEVRGLVEQARGVLRRTGEVDLATCERTFAIRANDALICQLGPGLVAAARAQAPHVRLRFLAEGEEDVQPLRDGVIDLDLGVIDDLGPEIEVEPLWQEGTALIAAPGHPIARGRMTLRRLAALPHLAISRRGRSHGPLDELLAAQGLSREVVAVVPTPTAAMHLVLATELVCLVNRDFGEFAARACGVRLLSVPGDLPVKWMSQAWHPRLTADPAHRWLREQVRRLRAGR